MVDVRFPVGDLGTGVSFDLPPDIEVELDQIVPRGRTEAVPFVWVRTEDFEDFEGAMDDHPRVTAADALGARDGWRLYRIDWTPPEDLCEAVALADAAIVEGGVDGETLRLRLRFPDDESVTLFGERCAEGGLSMTPVRIFRPGEERRETGLTDEQRETLLTAFRLGYFDVPRRATLLDIADELGLSDQAVSERIRRGVSCLVEDSVVSAE